MMMGHTQKNTTFILASGSPRRRELLALTGWEAIVSPVEVDERPLTGESAQALARRLAMAKAQLAAREQKSKAIILSADTMVAQGEHLLGKPSDAGEAERMLVALRGRSHHVVTALVLIDRSMEREVVEVCETMVPMRDYTEDEVAAYIASGEPFDKAGGYAIQDGSFHPVALEALHGCYANVMGLPLCHLVCAMRRLGCRAKVDIPAACEAYTGYECHVFNQILEEQA
jgi:septum formation protein